jgi:hypothetical protein
MTDDPIPKLAKAMAVDDPTLGPASIVIVPRDALAEAMAEIRRLRERVAELEAINSMIIGTVRAGIIGELDVPAAITHGHAPSAPPHDE